jgi:hypothetical protein
MIKVIKFAHPPVERLRYLDVGASVVSRQSSRDKCKPRSDEATEPRREWRILREKGGERGDRGIKGSRDQGIKGSGGERRSDPARRGLTRSVGDFENEVVTPRRILKALMELLGTYIDRVRQHRPVDG